MAKKIYLLASLVGIIMAVVATACGKASTTKTEKVDGVEWNVSVRKAVQFNDADKCKDNYNHKDCCNN